MTDFNITHPDEVEWIIAHDPRARFSVGNYDRTDGGLTVRGPHVRRKEPS